MAFSVRVLVRASNFEVPVEHGAHEKVDDAWDQADLLACMLINSNSNDVVTIVNANDDTIFYDGSDWAKDAYLSSIRKLD